jgi:hypothetical protein
MLTFGSQLRIAGLTVGLLAATAGAWADIITQTFNIPQQTTKFTYPIDYNLFDSSLGTLTGVTLDLATASSVEVDIVNTNATAETFINGTATFALTVTGPPASTTYLSTSMTGGPVSGTANAASKTTFPGSVIDADSGAVPVPSADWPVNWEAPGGGVSLTDLLFSSDGGSFSGTETSGSGDLFFGGTGVVSGTLTLVYSYQPPSGTPEPGAWALLVASATVSVAGMRRRRARK